MDRSTSRRGRGRFGAIQRVTYDALEHVVITRAFLSNLELFLRHLMKIDDQDW